MESLRELYRIGYGPSSSHTMGPRAAAERFVKEHPEVKEVKVELYGSLAATGKGHLTDKAIVDVFNGKGIRNEIVWYPDKFKHYHQNADAFGRIDPLDSFCDFTHSSTEPHFHLKSQHNQTDRSDECPSSYYDLLQCQHNRLFRNQRYKSNWDVFHPVNA